ncbi:MAG: hypothetical protein V1743_02280 [Nanoarchaeota archaeon]
MTTDKDIRAFFHKRLMELAEQQSFSKDELIRSLNEMDLRKKAVQQAVDIFKLLHVAQCSRCGHIGYIYHSEGKDFV